METSFDTMVPEGAIIPENRIISGFWRRLLALALDDLIIFIPAFISGLFFFDFYAHLGGWGRLLGFVVALIYFGFLNSVIGKGQTLGKKIMKIEVVNKSGKHISLGRSILRYSILGVPFFFNGALITPTVVKSAIGYLIGFIVFGVGGAIIYLYIFNRRTRQSLHDLTVGTFVTKTYPQGSVSSESVWKPHLVIVGLWFVTVVGFILFMPVFMQKGIFPELMAVQQSIQSSDKVHAATAMVGGTWNRIEDKKRKTSYFSSSAILKERPKSYEAAAREIASIVFKSYPEIMKKDSCTVQVSYGYDIGIARSWQSQAFQHSPQEWQAILLQTEKKTDNTK